MKTGHRVIVLMVMMLICISIAFVFGQYSNRMTTYRSKVVAVGSAKQRVVVIVNPKTVGKTSVSLSSMSVILDNTTIDLSGGSKALLRVYINGNIQ